LVKVLCFCVIPSKLSIVSIAVYEDYFAAYKFGNEVISRFDVEPGVKLGCVQGYVQDFCLGVGGVKIF